MSLTATFVVPGKPVPKARPRFSKRTGRPYTPKTTRSYEALVASKAFFASRLTGPSHDLRLRSGRQWPEPERCGRSCLGRSRPCVCLWCSAQFEVRLVIYLPDRRRRDIDNINKALLDGMTGVLWRDDSQAVVKDNTPRLDRKNPRVEVEVRVIPPEWSSMRSDASELEPVQCSACEGVASWDVTLPSGAVRRIPCDQCAGTGRHP
jgi:Holliday junction resolvase RusA-like endonuclease